MITNLFCTYKILCLHQEKSFRDHGPTSDCVTRLRRHATPPRHISLLAKRHCAMHASFVCGRPAESGYRSSEWLWSLRTSRSVWRNPGHTGRPPARCLWVRSFSGGPRSEPDWHLSVHPALQRFSRAVRGWLPPAGCTQDFRRRFGVLHYAYLLASGHPRPPGPLRPAGGFPALPVV
jgi:hypothetical protein